MVSPDNLNSNESPGRVDFDHPELCTGCDPVACVVEGKNFSMGNWRDLLVALTEYFLSGKPQAEKLYSHSVYPNGERPFLLKDKPALQTRQVSNGYWIYMNLSIKDLVFTIGKLCRFCGVNLADVEITYVPKANKGLVDVPMAHSGIDNSEVFAQPIVPDSVLAVLRENYASGIRFDATALRLLSGKAGVEVDENMQTALKRQMFCRGDGIYFLLDHTADEETRREIVQFADSLLDEYGCFDVSELYGLYADRLNTKIVRSAEEFEKFYVQIGSSGVRCVAAPQFGNRIARRSNGSISEIFKELSTKIVAAIASEFFGSVNEDDLHSEFCAFSTNLLAKIIKYCAADELVRVEINDNICYQTFDALGLPKFNGTKGTGMLFKRSGLELPPLVFGGDQEHGLRAGTENVAGIAAAGYAIEESTGAIADESKRLSAMVKNTVEGIKEKIPSIRVNGDIECRLPGTVNFGFDGISGESLMHLLDLKGICVSTSSACMSGKDEPSHVLLALGLSEQQAKSSIRISYGRYNADEDVNIIVSAVCAAYNKIAAGKTAW